MNKIEELKNKKNQIISDFWDETRYWSDQEAASSKADMENEIKDIDFEIEHLDGIQSKMEKELQNISKIIKPDNKNIIYEWQFAKPTEHADADYILTRFFIDNEIEKFPNNEKWIKFEPSKRERV